jgi:hypothetical protein
MLNSGVGRGIAHVGAADQVDAAADAGAVHGGQHRLAAALQAGQRVLQVEDEAAQLLARAAVAVVVQRRHQLAEHLQVDAGGEVPALAFEHHHPNRRRLVQRGEGAPQLVPHGQVHRIGLVGPVHADGGDGAVGGHGEGFVGHGVAKRRCRRIMPRPNQPAEGRILAWYPGRAPRLATAGADRELLGPMSTARGQEFAEGPPRNQ